ncbi:MAG: glycosyltransferase family 2 protein [Oscillospiraceae bacterium]
MLLSIGMIVKNEEKYLDRCLSALLPLIEKIDCELIIADTGSTDNTVHIAKKYTDKVYSFKWVDDFSAARNYTLEKASGKWFMFIDADEVISDIDELVDFFRLGECERYNSAVYKQRNYSDLTLKDYSDYEVQRIVRVTEKTRFEKPIHEVLQPFSPPTKRLETVAHHYGYIYTSEKQKTDKFRRNTSLLLKRLESEENPDSLIYLQLSQSFSLYDKEKALEYLDIGVKKSMEEKSPVFFPLFAEKAALYYKERDWEKTAQVCRDYFSARKGLSPLRAATDAEMHGFCALSLQYLGRFDEAYEEHLRYREIYREISDGTLYTADMTLSCFYIANPSNLLAMTASFVDVCIALNRFETAAEQLENISCKSDMEQCRVLITVLGAGLDLSEYMQCFGNIRSVAGMCCKIYPQMSAVCERYPVSAFSQPQAARLMTTVYEVVMYYALSCGGSIEQLFSKWGKAGAMSDICDNKQDNSEVTAARCAEHIDSLRKAGRYKECYSEMLSLVKVYPAAKPIVLAIRDLTEKQRTSHTPEMERLSAEVKASIRALAGSGEYISAAELLSELERIVPDDEDIPELRRIVSAEHK